MKTLGAFFCRGRLAVGVAWIGLSLASSLAPAAYANFKTLDMAAGRSLSPLAQHPIPVQRNAGTSTDALAIRQGYLFGGTERVIKAAIFESDKRQPLSDLRRRDPDLDFVRFLSGPDPKDAFVSDELEGIAGWHDAASKIIDVLPCSAV